MGTELPFTIDRPDTTTYTDQIIRAYLPDGSTRDSEVESGVDPGEPQRGLARAFGNWAYPPGTRFEQLQRTVRVEVGGWRVVAEETDDSQDTARTLSLNEHMLRRLRQCAADTTPNCDGQITVYPVEARQLVALIDQVAAERRSAEEPST